MWAPRPGYGTFQAVRCPDGVPNLEHFQVHFLPAGEKRTPARIQAGQKTLITSLALRDFVQVAHEESGTGQSDSDGGDS